MAENNIGRPREDGSGWVSDVPWREACGRHLVQQRPESVVVVLVDNDDLHILARQGTGSGQAREPCPDDNHHWRTFPCLCTSVGLPSYGTGKRPPVNRRPALHFAAWRSQSGWCPSVVTGPQAGHTRWAKHGGSPALTGSSV